MNVYIKIIAGLLTLSLVVSCGGGGTGNVKSAAPDQVTVTPPVASKVTVSTILSPGGQISASESRIDKGESAQFTLTPNSNYVLSSVSGCNGALTNTTYVTAPVLSDCTVFAEFLYVNQPPTVRAVLMPSGEDNSTINLQANASDPDGTIVEVEWSQTSGEPLVTSNRQSPSLVIKTAPSSEARQATFQVKVTDSAGDHGYDTITVTIDKLEQEPTSVVLVGASALSANSISVDWFKNATNIEAHDNKSYHVHVSDQSGFVPSLANTKVSVIGQTGASVSGLASGTTYYVIISAQDSAQNIIYSNELDVTTMASAPVVKADQVFTEIASLIVSDNSLRYALNENDVAPQIGEVIVSPNQNGILRKVTGVSVINTDNGRVVEVQTQSASLNEIYNDVDINTTVKLIDIPDNVALTTSKLQVLSSATTAIATNAAKPRQLKREINWHKSGLKLSQTITKPSSQAAAAFTQGIDDSSAKSKANSEFANQPSAQFIQEVKDKYLVLQGPTRVAFMPGKLNTFDINAKVINDPNNLYEVVDFTLVGITHQRILPSKTNFNANFANKTDQANPNSKTMQLIWEPVQSDIDSQTAQPYIATFSAKVRDKNCRIACVKSIAIIEVKIHVGEAQIRPSSSLAFVKTDTTTPVTIKGSGQYKFDPTVNVAARIENAALKSAQATVKGLLDLQVKLDITADAAGRVSGSAQLMQKAFSKTLIVGGAPVVIHGDFIIKGEYKGQSQGQLNVEQMLDISYYFDAGFDYKNGTWTPVFNGKPNLSYKLVDGAKSQVYAEFTLVPELQLRVYEHSAGLIKIEPRAFAEVSVEGEFIGLTASAATPETAGDYRFTTLAAGMGTTVKLKANFAAFDNSLQAWPVLGENDLLAFEVLAPTQLYGIPAITVQDKMVFNASNSCQIAATANVTPLTLPFITPSFSNMWELDGANWALLSSSINYPQDAITIENQDFSSSAMATASTFSQFRLRYTGFSSLGAWAKQYQDISFDFEDNNNDDLPDYWANKFGVSNLNSNSAPNNDNDNDSISNADEFNHCTFPNKQDSDSDGMPDDWEVLYALNPIFNDANLDSDNDDRSNLQEFLDKSDPLVEDLNQSPLVQAGQNQQVDELSLVTLSGTATDGGAITSTRWTQIAGPLVGLDRNDALETSFVAPSVTKTTILSFTLTATDNSGASSSDSVDIILIPSNEKPIAIAGADLRLISGERGVFDASASFDADGTIQSYQWSVLNDQTLDIASTTSETTSFTAPSVLSTTTFVVSLLVTDNQGAFDTSLIEVEVSPNADLPPLSSIALTQLNNSILEVKGVDANNRHTTLALLLADPTQTNSQARVYIATEVFDEVNNQTSTLETEASLNWYTQNNNLIIESEAFGSHAIAFTNGIVNLEQEITILGQIIDAFTNRTVPSNINAKVSGLYTQNRLITDDLTGYRFTLLKNGKNTVIDFVTNTYAFMYEQGSLEIQSINWSYTINEQGKKEISLGIDPNSPVIENHSSFATWDTIDADIIVDIAVLPDIDTPLSELEFSDANAAACVADAARSNNWLSVDDVKHLNCSSLNIGSAVGIEKLSALKTLNLSDNTLVNIDLSQLTELSSLNLTNNNLTSINFTNNPLLDTVSLTNNNLSNATIAYLSTISWINSLGFDSAAVLPNGSDFVIRVTLGQQEFSLFTNPSFDYDYTVDWGDGTVNSNYTQDAVHTYTQAGEYEITISGKYPALKFCDNNEGCSSFKIDVLQWGASAWRSMQGAFSGLSKLTILASDVPNLSQVRDLSFMFYKASNFNSDISQWDVSSATSMEFMFGLASSFNSDISQWNTSNVIDMGGLFYLASRFNGDIGQWDTSNVTRMQSLFAFATDFNSDISQWDTSSVTQMATMFLGATNFNGDLSLWNTASVENMNKMFFNATSMTGNLSSWQVSQSLRHNDFTHQGSLLIEPIWKN